MVTGILTSHYSGGGGSTEAADDTLSLRTRAHKQMSANNYELRTVGSSEIRNKRKLHKPAATYRLHKLLLEDVTDSCISEDTPPPPKKKKKKEVEIG